MPTATLTSKGQTVIPKVVREAMGLQAGDRVDFILQDRQTVIMKPAAQSIRELKGILYKPGRKAISLDDMQKVIRRRGGQLA